VSITPDTLFFTIGVLAEKKVPVRHQLNLTTEKEYMLKDSIVLSPDSVIVSGTQASIDTISYIAGTPKTLHKLSESVEGSFELLQVKGIHIAEPKIHYYANIIRYTEGYLKSVLQVKDLPPNVSITLLPNEVELRYRAALSDFLSIDTSQFVASVSYKDVSQSNDRTLAVQVSRKPKEALSVYVSPPFVEFIIRKN
jgi:YbbR domain-containing protein